MTTTTIFNRGWGQFRVEEALCCQFKQDGGRSEEKRNYAVNSKQKLTKNLFLVGSFLTCWLAGPFCRYLPLSTNDFEDGGRINRILAGNRLEGQGFFGGEGESFLV
jgi:hypothetical protein